MMTNIALAPALRQCGIDPRSDRRGADPSAPVPRQRKRALVEQMLRAVGGASIDELCAATGWQRHSCRAFLTGLRKQGRDIARIRLADGSSRYGMLEAAV